MHARQLSNELTAKLIALMEQRQLQQLNKALRNLLLFYLQQKLPGPVPAWFSNQLPGMVELLEILDTAATEAGYWPHG